MVSSWLCGVRAEGRILRSSGDVEERFFPGSLESIRGPFRSAWMLLRAVLGCEGFRYFEAALDVRGNSGAFSRSPGGILEAPCRIYGVINIKLSTETKDTLKGSS